MKSSPAKTSRTGRARSPTRSSPTSTPASPAPDPRRPHASRDSSARPPLSRADGGRAVALVYVAEGHASWPRAGAVVAHHLELGVVAVGRAHRPHAGLGAQHV